MALKIPIILMLTFVNIESIIARPQFPSLQPPGPPREPAPIHEPQTEDILDGQRALFTSFTNTNRQYFGTNGLNHNIPSYSTSAIRTPLFSPHRSIAAPITSSGASIFRSVVQNQAKTTLTYSDAPSVSHVTFTAEGSSYSW